MKSSELEYELPRDLIAQEPPARREEARLMVVDRAKGTFSHRGVRDLPALLRRGDCLVVNETRVLPAKLRLVKETGGAVEALLLGGAGTGTWEALLSPGKRVRPGLRLAPEAEPSRPVLEVVAGPDGGRWRLREVEAVPGGLAESMGDMPLPPYIRRDGDGRLRALDRERYQTVYARIPGSVAAPTAGLHMTDALLGAIAGAGVEVARIVLHVGPGTFRPLVAEVLEDHRMESERWEISAASRAAIGAAISAGRRIVAVGTTSVRALESMGSDFLSEPGDAAGETGIFIRPGYEFRVVGALLTNFHLPRSTPLALAGAFAGLDLLRRAYAEAVSSRYRFLSYGDAMLIE